MRERNTYASTLAAVCAADACEYDLEASISWGDGSSSVVRTAWCSPEGAAMPDAFDAFLSAANALCRQVLDMCL